MANFASALDFLMIDEDSQKACAIEPDPPGKWDHTVNPPVWRGAHAISGINSAAYPSQYATIAALPQQQRWPAVENFYQLNFWNRWYDQIVSDIIAERIFDTEVNEGPETGVEIAQRAVNFLGGAQIGVDGGWGPITVEAINNQNSMMLLNAFRHQRLAAYQKIVAQDPSKAHYLGTAENPGPWWIRAMK